MTKLTSLYVVTKEVKFVRHPIAKPFNSVLVRVVPPRHPESAPALTAFRPVVQGESFHCYYDTPVLELHPKKKHPLPAIHVDEDPHPEIITCAGRGSNNTTSAAPLKSLPSITSIYNTNSTDKKNGTSASAATTLTSRNVASSASSTRSNVSGRSIASTVASSSASTSSGGPARDSGRNARVVIINEQTSHHPPISHFVAEARVSATDGPDKDKEPRIVRLRGVDQLSAKFTGANVRVVPGTHNKGLFLELADGEEYRITHPTAAVAGLLRASPYATITDSTTITCLRPARGEEEGNGKRLRAIVQYIEEVRLPLPSHGISAVN